MKSKTGARDFLLEIGCEEIPADYMPGVLEWDDRSAGLVSSANRILSEQGVVWKKLECFGTPRRLVLKVSGVHPVVQKKEKGPTLQIAFDAQGKPTRAAEGFAQRHGLKVSQLSRSEESKVVYAEYDVPVEKILAEAIPKIIGGVSFPKTMRWDETGSRFARPVRWIVALYGSKVVPAAFGAVKTNRMTQGTRRSGLKPFSISSVAEYFKVIKKAGITLETGTKTKRTGLLKQLEVAAKKCGGQLPDQTTEEFEWLLNTATFLAEDPVVAVGSFQAEYLELPPEVLATSMAKHLKLFSVFSPDGKKLPPKFLAVLEGKPTQPARVMANVERILEARFTDARFFYREDTKTSLESKVPLLAKVVFHEKLGTVEERIPRLEKLMGLLADRIQAGREVRGGIARSARLAKADLVTQMVREFPSLQGVIGGQYALQSGEPEEVARAITEQYRPRTAGDPVPATPPGALLGLADRIDMLVGYFGVGLKPTGSADPYGLRRQALGLVRILLEPPKGVSFVGLSIDSLFEQGIQSWGSRITADPAKLKKELAFFLRERFETLLFVVGKIDRPLIEAVLDADGKDFAGAKERLDLLQAWWAEKHGSKRQMLERAAKVAERTGRIVRSVGSMELPAQVDPGILREPVEKELWERWNQIAPRLKSHLEQRQFERATEAYSALYPVVHTFFEKVFVMDEDLTLRKNRLALLREIFQGLAGRFADLSKIPLPGAGPS